MIVGDLPNGLGRACKSKSHIVANFLMRPCALSCIEKAGYGVHAVTATAPALGLTVHCLGENF